MSVCIIVLTMQFYFQIELRQKFLKYIGKTIVSLLRYVKFD